MEAKKKVSGFKRVDKVKNYTVIDNDYLRRDDLSFRAKGLLTYLLFLPDDWEVHLSELSRHGTEGQTALRNAWKELQYHGYVHVYAVRLNGSIVYWQTDIYERPSDDEDYYRAVLDRQRAEAKKKEQPAPVSRISFDTETARAASRNAGTRCDLLDNLRRCDPDFKNRDDRPPVPIHKIIGRGRARRRLD